MQSSGTPGRVERFICCTAGMASEPFSAIPASPGFAYCRISRDTSVSLYCGFIATMGPLRVGSGVGERKPSIQMSTTTLLDDPIHSTASSQLLTCRQNRDTINLDSAGIFRSYLLISRTAECDQHMEDNRKGRDGPPYHFRHESLNHRGRGITPAVSTATRLSQLTFLNCRCPAGCDHKIPPLS